MKKKSENINFLSGNFFQGVVRLLNVRPGFTVHNRTVPNVGSDTMYAEYQLATIDYI